MSESLKEKTAKGLLWGGLSNGFQQLLTLVFGIFLANLLSPDDYGITSMLAIFVGLASSLSESGFTVALVNKKDVTHRDYNAVFWSSLLIGVCTYIILFFCAPLIASFYGKEELIWLSRFLFLGFLFSSTSVVHNAILFRNLRVKQKAISQVIGLIISGTTGIIMALNNMAYWAIAAQTVAYIAVSTFFFWFFSSWRPSFPVDFSPIKSMIGFSSKVLITNIFTQLNNNLFTTLLGKFYESSQTGYFFQANKWTSIGYNFVHGMTNSVAQPVLTQVTHETARQANIFRKMLRFTAFVSFPAMFGLALIAEEFILVTIGAKWLPAVPILQLLCIWGAFFPINMLYSNLIISRYKSNIYMFNTITLGLTQLVVMLLVYPYGIYTMLIFYISINIGWLFVWHYFAWKQISLSLWHALKDIVPFGVVAAACIVTTYFLTKDIGNIYLMLILKIAITATLYILLMWISGSVTYKESISYLLKKKYGK